MAVLNTLQHYWNNVFESVYLIFNDIHDPGNYLLEVLEEVKAQKKQKSYCLHGQHLAEEYIESQIFEDRARPRGIRCQTSLKPCVLCLRANQEHIKEVRSQI